MKPPDNDKSVLTWVKDSGNLEYWQIDIFLNGGWLEATAWEQEVLHWQELPNPPMGTDEKKWCLCPEGYSKCRICNRPVKRK